MASPIFTKVRSPDASTKTSPGTNIVGFLKSLGMIIKGCVSGSTCGVTASNSSLIIEEYSIETGVVNF